MRLTASFDKIQARSPTAFPVSKVLWMATIEDA
jgi:hypothetical protein